MKLFYIQNTKAGFLGNAILFYKIGNCGYTADLDQAAKYTEDEAKTMILQDSYKNKAWPVDYIDDCKGIQRIVDSQYLDKDQKLKP